MSFANHQCTVTLPRSALLHIPFVLQPPHHATGAHDSFVGPCCILDNVFAESSLYNCSAPAATLEAVPTEKQFLEALHALGVSQDTAAGKSEAQKANAATAAATEPSLVKGTLSRLQLLLQTFAAVCQYQHKQVPVHQPLSAVLQPISATHTCHTA